MADDVHITIKNRWLFPLLGGVVGLALVNPGPMKTAILIILSGLILICGGWTWTLSKNISSDRRLTREWLLVGDRLIEQLAIHNRSWLPAVWLEFYDESTVPGYRRSVAYEVPSNFSLHWRVTSACRRRGRYQLGPWSLTTGDPFGLFETTLVFKTVKEIVIFPPSDANINLDPQAGKLQGAVNASRRSLQLTEAVSTLREYAPGDPLKWIHWPTTAHKGSLMVRQFERNIRSDIWIVVDGNQEVQLGEGNESTEEVAVLLAAALVEKLSRHHRQVGLMTFGESIAQISSEESADALQLWRSHYQLAMFEANGHLPIHDALWRSRASMRSGSSVIVITPDDNPAILEPLAALTDRQITATILLLDRLSFGGRPRDDLKATSNLIQEYGHRIMPIKRGEIISPTYEEGKKENLVTTPMGRTIDLKRR